MELITDVTLIREDVVQTHFTAWPPGRKAASSGDNIIQTREMTIDSDLAIKRLSGNYWCMQRERCDFKFFNSCVSEGLIPKGIKSKFTLARDVNDEKIVKKIQDIVDDQGSKILDSFLMSAGENLKKFEEIFFEEKVRVIRDFGTRLGWALISQAKLAMGNKIWHKENTQKKKLMRLRKEKINDENLDVGEKSQGSRQINTRKYVKAPNNGGFSGCPFPKNLRPHRRNRPRRRNNNSDHSFEISPADLEARNPVIVTDREVNLTEPQLSLFRKGAKFVPTPKKPVNNKELYEEWLTWRERMRWTWFHAKQRNFQGDPPEFEKTPWYQNTQRKAPPASPAVENFMDRCYADTMNPNMRNKIKDNLEPEEREALKELRFNFPAQNLRIRREDKGSRFVIADGNEEDRMIEQDLQNEVNFTEIPHDPREEHIDKLKQWIMEFKNEGVEDDIEKFVLKGIEDSHPARPKPLHKTHKLDDEGNMQKPVPIRNVSTACGTPTSNAAKVAQTVIKHLTSEEHLPRNNKSTNAALRRINFINENCEALDEKAVMVFPDIVRMYPSTDVNEAVEEVRRKHVMDNGDHELSTEAVIELLRICNSCNCIEFNGKYYIPCSGCPTGPAHICEMTDVWMGAVVEKHLQTNPVDTVHYSQYRDDGLDVLKDAADLPRLKEHFNNLHPNLSWEINSGREGPYLDLWVMIKNGKIETRIFAKSESIYINPDSCHDPSVFKSIYRGVGLRLRLNCSKDEDFDEAVEKYAKSFAVSGHNHRRAKFELNKARSIDRKAFLNNEKARKEEKKRKNRGKVFWINRYDPRVPHARHIISRNYHILDADPIAKQVFPRQNLVAGSRRGRNLQELISPTVQKQRDNTATLGPVQPNGSYQCSKYKAGRKCDVCSHMRDGVTFIHSRHFNTKIPIRGHLVHEPYEQKEKLRWFIYQIEDIHCGRVYVGSSTNIYSRWSSHKSDCNNRRGDKSGLAKHFSVGGGCPGDVDKDKKNLELTLLEGMDVTKEEMVAADHKPGPGCICSLCQRLKGLEDYWILQVGSYFWPNMNIRDEIKQKSRTGRTNFGS